MTARAVDLPELRAEALLHQAATGTIMRSWAEAAHPTLLPGDPARSSEFARRMWRREIERLGSADLYFVSSEMTQLASIAAHNVPAFQLGVADLPSRNGLIVFEGGLPGGMKFDDGSIADTQAVLWSSDSSGIYVTGYLDRDLLLERARASGAAEAERRLLAAPRLYVMPTASFTCPFDSDSWVQLDRGTAIWSLFPQLVTVWLLMQQPLARVDETVPDRAARKRLRRVGQESAPVRVIRLRRPERGEAGGSSDREYHHQWIVRGHWRQQWYPSREVHRPVWIAPHVKGPEGAPLLGGEKVHAWVR